MNRMNRKKLQEALRALKLYNDHGLLMAFGRPGEDVAVTYHPTEHGRSGIYARTQVWSPRLKTDPKGPWYNHGRKTFLGSRAESLSQGLEWAEDRFGITEWAGSPFFPPASNRIPAYVLKAAVAAVKRGSVSESGGQS